MMVPQFQVLVLRAAKTTTNKYTNPSQMKIKMLHKPH